MNPSMLSIVEHAMLPVTRMTVPSILSDSVEQQRRHLVGLGTALKAGGQSIEVIERVIADVAGSYEAELRTTIFTLRENSDDL